MSTGLSTMSTERPAIQASPRSRVRLLFGALAMTCVLGVTVPGSAGAAHTFTLDTSPDSPAGEAVDNVGTGYFAWEHGVAGSESVTRFCKVARGGSCTNPITLPTPPLNPAPFDSTAVSAAFPVLGAGSTVYVVGPRYVAGDVVMWTSTDGGATFGPAVQVTPSGGYSGSDPTGALAFGAGFYISSANPGLYFTDVPTTGSGADLTPAGGLTNIGDSTFGLAGGGATGSPVEAFAMLHSGQPDTIGFVAQNGGGDPNDPGTWSAATQVTAGILPSLAGGPKGLFLASQDAANGTYTPVDVRRYGSGGFGAPVTLSKDTSSDNAGSIFQTPGSGQLFVAWQGTTLSDGGTGIRLYRSTDGGAGFTSLGDIAEGAPNYAIGPNSIRVAAADDGQGFATFTDYGGGQTNLRVTDFSPIDATMDIGQASVSGGAIVDKLTVSAGGKLVVSSQIINAGALAAAARKRCRSGYVLVSRHGKLSCVSNSFGTKTVKLPAAGTYRIKLSPNAAARKALATGKTLKVSETLNFKPAGGLKPVVKHFRVTVKGSRHKH